MSLVDRIAEIALAAEKTLGSAARTSRQPRQRVLPERILLPVREGAEPSSKPPVRIFLGTEASQYRAERIFVWSIERVRDPGRVYEIYLMKHLAGFNRRFWTTSFTNHRFAVPHFAGGAGKAIWNDVDQIYLADPGALFDLDLEGHGYRAISETETSVMLMDCARMLEVWPIELVRSRAKKSLLARALEVEGLYGRLAPEWNARDQEEYVEGRTGLLHYTTLHTQPWRPFPERFFYQENPVGHLFFDLEKSANEAGFQVFSREHPSAFFDEVLRESAACSAAATTPALGPLDGAVRQLARRAQASSLLELVPGRGEDEHADCSRWGGLQTTRAGLASVLQPGAPARSYDGVACLEGLEDIPSDDVPWVVDELFGRAERFVFAAVRCPTTPPDPGFMMPPSGTAGLPTWWAYEFEAAAARRPEVHWEIAIVDAADGQPRELEYRIGGRFLGEAPSVWVVTDGELDHVNQARALAEELGWPWTRIDLDAGVWAGVVDALLGRSRLGLAAADTDRLAPPWPDLVIAAGGRSTAVARWIRKQSRCRTRSVELDAASGSSRRDCDLLVAPAYEGLYPDQRLVETTLPLVRIPSSSLEEAAQRWRSLADESSHPRIALLVGGESPDHAITPRVARQLGHDVREMAIRVGGSVLVDARAAVSPAAVEALRAALGTRVADFHRSSPAREAGGDLLVYLALADAIVVTGDSPIRIAQACEAGVPVSIYPVPEADSGLAIAHRWVGAARDALVSQAYARPRSWRGAVRPQKGLEHFVARLVADGIVRPRRDLGRMLEALVDQGRARRFDGTLGEAPPRRYGDLAHVAERVRTLLGAVKT
jgi:mitochondrial fission protein ELM1